MKAFVNNKAMSLTEATIKAFKKKSDAYKIQINVIFNLNFYQSNRIIFLLDILKAIGIIQGSPDSYEYKGAFGFQQFVEQCKLYSGIEEVEKPLKPKVVQPCNYSFAMAKKRKRPEIDSTKENNTWELFKGEGAFKRVNALVDRMQAS